MISESNNPQAKPFKKSRPSRIVHNPFVGGMTGTVNFDDQFQLGAVEIDNVGTNRALTAET